MDQILAWANDYSALGATFLVGGAALVYVIRIVVDKAIAAEFDKRNKRLELLLKRRSDFEERVLLDQYESVSRFILMLGKIGADLNRRRNGIEVSGLMSGTEIVPLSELYIELESKRFFLKPRQYEILRKSADNLLEFAKAEQHHEMLRVKKEQSQLKEELIDEMNKAFGINSISWADLAESQ
jgi:hypothetical protein